MSNNDKTEIIDDESLDQVKGGSGKGSQLLGHELTHVNQARKGVASIASGNPEGVASTAGGTPDGIKKVISSEAGKGEI